MRGFAWRLQSRQRVKLLRPQRHEHFPRNADRKHHRLFDLGSRDDVLFAPAAAFLFLPAQFSVYRPALPGIHTRTGSGAAIRPRIPPKVAAIVYSRAEEFEIWL